MNNKRIHSPVLLGAFALGLQLSNAAVLSQGPDGWNRGDSGSVYFGWDDFEAAGAPGPFGNRVLNDSTPDVGSFGVSTSLVEGPTSTYGHRSGSGNIYSGFTGSPLDLVLTFDAFGSVGSGATTIFLTMLGNPADTNVLEDIVLSAGGAAFAPTQTLIGPSAEDPNGSNAKVWVAEWQLAGHESEYSIQILSNPTVEGGTDVAIDSLTVDAIWRSDASPLANTAGAESLGGIAVVPEPSSLLLGLFGLLMLPFTRRRV